MVKSVLFLDIYNTSSHGKSAEPQIRQIELQNVIKLPDHIGHHSYFFDELQKKKLDVSFVEKDKIYFTPGCTVPRGKFLNSIDWIQENPSTGSGTNSALNTLPSAIWSGRSEFT